MKNTHKCLLFKQVSVFGTVQGTLLSLLALLVWVALPLLVFVKKGSRRDF